MIKNTLIFIVVLLIYNNSIGQNVVKDVKANFSLKDYKAVYKELAKKLSGDTNNVEYHYMYGVSLLETYIDKQKSIKHLEFALKSNYPDPMLLFYLGKAYQLNYRFDEAVDKYFKFRTTAKLTPDELSAIDRQIESCKNAKILTKQKVNVSFENLGDKVNSPYNEVSPYIPESEEYLIYSSDRDKTTGGLINIDGSFFADLYMCDSKNDEFDKSKNMGGQFNSSNNDHIVGLSRNGNYLIVSRDQLGELSPSPVYDIFISEKKGKTFGPLQLQSKTMNTQYLKSSVTLDENGEYAYVSLFGKDSYGGYDIYIQRRLPNGEWSEPKNLGPEINTPYDEDYPAIYDEGKTLYFCSRGHNSMGGFDIFKSEIDPKTMNWGKAKNLGYPINTPDDEKNISINIDESAGYMSRNMDDAIGGLDIYKVTFNDVTPKYSIVTGQVQSSDSINLFQADKNLLNEDLVLIVTKRKSDEVIGKYRPNKTTGKYVIALNPGIYEIKASLPNYDELNQVIKINGKSKYKTVIIKPIVFYRPGKTPMK